MQVHLFSAAVVTVAVGIVHSILGERLIFNQLRGSPGLVPDGPAPPLRPRHVRILWATWHLASVFGFAAVGHAPLDPTVAMALILAFSIGSALVLFATRGRHPGWVGLLVVAALVHLSRAGTASGSGWIRAPCAKPWSV